MSGKMTNATLLKFFSFEELLHMELFTIQLLQHKSAQPPLLPALHLYQGVGGQCVKQVRSLTTWTTLKIQYRYRDEREKSVNQQQ